MPTTSLVLHAQHGCEIGARLGATCRLTFDHARRRDVSSSGGHMACHSAAHLDMPVVTSRIFVDIDTVSVSNVGDVIDDVRDSRGICHAVMQRRRHGDWQMPAGHDTGAASRPAPVSGRHPPCGRLTPDRSQPHTPHSQPCFHITGGRTGYHTPLTASPSSCSQPLSTGSQQVQEPAVSGCERWGAFACAHKGG